MTLEYALSYAARGWAVFPLVPGGKAPLTAHGFKEATVEPEQIETWWAKWPNANIGIATGQKSGIVVIDIDRKNGIDGAVAAAELELPKTLVIRTPSGGYHAYLHQPTPPIPRRIGVRPGLDILGDGGYVVAAGSMVDGRYYEIVSREDVAICPQSVIDLCAKPGPRVAPSREGESERIAEGGRNNFLTKIGGKLRRIGFSIDEMTSALLTINSTRIEKPLSEAEVRRVAHSVARYLPDQSATLLAETTIGELVPLALADLLAAKFPEPEFLMEPLFRHPGLSMIYGPTGVSKTYFCLALALAISSGHKIMRYGVPKARGVLYVDGELGNRSLQDRIRRLMGGHEFAPESFHTLTRDDQAGGILPDLNDINAQTMFLACIPEGVELVVLDNLSTLTTGADGKESNAWESWDSMQRLLLELRRRGISCWIVHHANKSGLEQSGTERKKHIMDTVVSLRRHEAVDGAVPGFTDIEIHIVKGRDLPPGHVEPYLATLANPPGDPLAIAWEGKDLGDRKSAQIEELLKLGMPVGQVVTEVGCASSFAYRVKDRLVKAGEIKYTPRQAGRPKKGTGEFE